MGNGKPFPDFFRHFVQPCLTLLELFLSIEYMLRSLPEFFQDSFLGPYVRYIKHRPDAVHLIEFISKRTKQSVCTLNQFIKKIKQYKNFHERQNG